MCVPQWSSMASRSQPHGGTPLEEQAQKWCSVLSLDGRRALLLLCLLKGAALLLYLLGVTLLQKYRFGRGAAIAITVVALGTSNALIFIVGVRLRDRVDSPDAKRVRRPGRPPGAAPKGKAKPKPRPKATCGDVAGGGSEPRMPDFSPTVKVRQVYWSSFRLQDAHAGSFWSTVSNQDAFVVDPASIEDAFGDNQVVVTSKLPQIQCRLKVLSDARRKKILVMIPTLPCRQELQRALLDMDRQLLNRDQVERLLSNIPTPDEIHALLLSGEKGAELEGAENFLLALNEIPQLQLRLQVMHFENCWNDHIQAIASAETALSSSINYLMNSISIRHLLQMTLFIGNYLNSGTARGRADGFAVEALISLRDVKQADGTRTLINYITEQMEQKHPGELSELFAPDQAADCIKLASRHNSAEVMANLISLMHQAKHLLHLLREQCDATDSKMRNIPTFAESDALGSIQCAAAASMHEGISEKTTACNSQASCTNSEADSDDLLQEECMNVFVTHCQKFADYVQELGKLSAQVDSAHKKFKMLCDWFHVDQSNDARTSAWFFDIWNRFLMDVHGALREQEEREKSMVDAHIRRNSLGTPRNRISFGDSTPRSPSLTPRDHSFTPRMRTLSSTPRSKGAPRFRHSWPVRPSGRPADEATASPRKAISKMQEYTSGQPRRSLRSSCGITPRMLMQQPASPRKTTPLSSLMTTEQKG